MPADKSWQGDQSIVHPDQNHTPDTVVVFPDRLGKYGERDSDKEEKASQFFCFFFKNHFPFT